MTEQEWLSSVEPWAMLRWLTDRPQQAASGREKNSRHPGRRKLRLFSCAAWRTIRFDRSAGPNDDLPILAAAEAWADGGPKPEPERIRYVGTHRLLENAERAAMDFATPDHVDDRRARAALMREVFGNPYRPVVFRPEWRTPTVLTVGHAAYLERPGRVCTGCKGARFVTSWCKEEGAVWDDCPDCKGKGRIEDGTLDPARLAVLSDALEEAGCDDEAVLRHLRGWRRCRACPRENYRHHKRCVCFAHGGWIRDGSPHVRGCWALDLVLGR